MQEYRLIRSRRRTLALVVTAEGHVQVRAPMRATQSQIQRMLEKHEEWIRRKRAQQLARLPEPIQFVEGERLPVHGDWLPLRFGATGRSSVLVSDGSLLVTARFQSSRERLESAMIRFYKNITLECMKVHVSELRHITGLVVSRVGVTMARRRWGSCSSKGNLNFSYRVGMAPPFVQRYLAVHEMAHLVHPNHSRDFWKQVADWMPDYRIAETWLKKEGAGLPL